MLKVAAGEPCDVKVMRKIPNPNGMRIHILMGCLVQTGPSGAESESYVIGSLTTTAPPTCVSEGGHNHSTVPSSTSKGNDCSKLASQYLNCKVNPPEISGPTQEQ